MNLNLENPLRTKSHCVLACSGIHADSSLLAFFEYVEGLYQKLDLPISRFGHDAARGSLSFRRLQKRIRSLLPTARSIDVCSLPDGVEHSFEYCRSQALFSKEHASLSVGFEAEIVPARSVLWHDISRFLIESFGPRYAYLFVRPYDHGPYLYTVCAGTDKKFTHEENGRINQWSEALRDDRYLSNGWLREAFPWNFLGNSHLDAPVGIQTLRQWILASKDRGTLTPVTPDLMLWDVPDERIAPVGQELMAAGRVFDYMRDIVAKMPPTQPMSLEEAMRVAAHTFGFDSPDEVELRKADNTPMSREETIRILRGKPKK